MLRVLIRCLFLLIVAVLLMIVYLRYEPPLFQPDGTGPFPDSSELKPTPVPTPVIPIARRVLTAVHDLPQNRTVRTVVQALESDVRREMKPLFEEAGIRWPAQRIRFLVFKEEKLLEIWGANTSKPLRYIATCPIQAASGTSGPKRRMGDEQVPEGFYKIEKLNPESLFHLSLRVSYPNAEDRAREKVHTSKLGNDIYIHGNRVSIGCMAMGDAVVERLFTLAALARPGNCDVIIAPCDLRNTTGSVSLAGSTDMDNLYKRLQTKLKEHGIPEAISMVE